MLARFFARTWLLAPLVAVGFLLWVNRTRMERINYLSGVPGWSTDAAVADPASPTGYAGGWRRLVTPVRNGMSYRWIIQTEQLVQQPGWRVRRLNYENAPLGRDTLTPSPYGWLLGLGAMIDRAWAHRSWGLAVERAAMLLDPILQGLSLLGGTWCVARWFGAAAAGWVAIAFVTIFPLAGAFLPGAPDHHSLAWGLALGSILPLLAALSGWRDARQNFALSDSSDEVIQPKSVWLVSVAGAIGGIGLWVDVTVEAPVIFGLGLGAIASIWLDRRSSRAPSAPIFPWLTWALAGGLTCLAAYLVDYAPDHLGLASRIVHPLYGLAWLGLGLLLTVMERVCRGPKIRLNWRQGGVGLLSLLAVAALPVASRWAELDFFPSDPLATRLTFIPRLIAAKSLAHWLARDGLTAVFWACALPLLLGVPALLELFRDRAPLPRRNQLVLALGLVVVALGLSIFQLRYWNLLDVALIVLAAVWLAPIARPNRPLIFRRWREGFAVLVLVPGIFLYSRAARTDPHAPLNGDEVGTVVDRDLAYWLAQNAGGADKVVLTTPELTEELQFFSGLRGLGTTDLENRDGFKAVIRLAGASSETEASLLLRNREVSYLIIPSWDSALDDAVRLARGLTGTASLPGNSLMAAIHGWSLYAWMRPVPYHLPKDRGLEGISVVVLAIGEEEEPVVAVGRLADYFVENEQTAYLPSIREKLRQFPRDPGALAALAQVEVALGESREFDRAVQTLVPYLSAGLDQALPFDRRLALAVVLTEAKRMDLARAQMARCVAEVDEDKLRSLTTSSLVRFLALSRIFKTELADARLHTLALSLLPPSLREKFQPPPRP